MNYRLDVFYDQKQFVDVSNEEYEANIIAQGETLSGPMFALNMFADLSNEEFKAKYTGLRNPQSDEVVVEEATDKSEFPLQKSDRILAASELGQTSYLVKIRHQGGCGSCWAFSTITTMEKLHWDKTKTRLDLSQQELVDCDTRSYGCNGGFPEYAIAYIATNGIGKAASYPYAAAQSSCKRSLSTAVKTGALAPPIKYYAQADANRLSNLGIHATISVFSSGKFRYVTTTDDIFDGKAAGECNNSCDHAINMFSSTGDVITVINSWGTTWGFKGMKKIRSCSTTNIYGAQARITHGNGAV